MTEEQAQEFIENGEDEHFKTVHPDYRHRATVMS